MLQTLAVDVVLALDEAVVAGYSLTESLIFFLLLLVVNARGELFEDFVGYGIVGPSPAFR